MQRTEVGRCDEIDGRPAVLFVVDELGVGGAPRMCCDLIQGLSTKFEIAVVTLYSKGALGEQIAQQGIPVRSLGLSRPFRLSVIRRGTRMLEKSLRDNGTRLVHAHLVASGLYGGLASRRAGVPAVYTVHGRPRDRRLRLLEATATCTFDRVVAVSEAMRRQMYAARALCRAAMVTTYNGIDPSSWTRTHAPRSSWRPDAPLVVTMIANFTPEKDHSTLLHAFQAFGQRWPKADLLLAGDGPLRRRMEEASTDLGLSRVRFLGCVDDTRSLLHQTDMLVLSTHTEGFSVSLLEAMAMGVPVIATDVGGNRESLGNGERGVLVPPGKPERLAEALLNVAANEDGRLLRARAARRAIEDEFSLQTMVEAYERLYAEVLRGA